jgi:hypothetical protein
MFSTVKVYLHGREGKGVGEREEDKQTQVNVQTDGRRVRNT